MGTFLIGWELGGERGHLALLEPVAQGLREHGHAVHVAVSTRDGIRADSPLRRGEIFLVPDWRIPDVQVASALSETLGDDLAATGLGESAQVLFHARWWSELIASLQADVVLAESAPGLLLAARGRCPAIAFGTAYSLPPSGRPLPPVLDVERPPAPGSLRNEASLCGAFDAADRALGGPGLGRFSELFDVPAWVCNLAELDPYGGLRSVAAPGPLVLRHASEALLRGRIPPLLGSHVFVYAKPSAMFPVLMEMLAERCRRIEVFLPGAAADMYNPWPHVTMHRVAIDLGSRLHEFSAVVHFGGLNLAAEALLTGLPQLVFPQHLEQSATAAAIQKLGTGYACLGLPREREREAQRRELIGRAVGAFFADVELPGRAARFASRLRARQKPSLPGLLELCGQVWATRSSLASR